MVASGARVGYAILMVLKPSPGPCPVLRGGERKLDTLSRYPSPDPPALRRHGMLNDVLAKSYALTSERSSDLVGSILD
jgi:hypothetical protein